jgi:predicted ATPase
LVGRSHELDFLKSEYDAIAGEGGGRLIFIGGEPGVGKTRLAREAGRYARLRGGHFLEGHYLRDGTAPYGPWMEALRAALSERGREELAQLVGPYGPELVQIMPELGDRLDAVAPSAAYSPDEQHRRLYDGVPVCS